MAVRVSSRPIGSGQIAVSADFIAEICRTLEVSTESDQSGSTESKEGMDDDASARSIRCDLTAHESLLDEADG